MFEKIYDIITIEKNKNLSLISYSVDFEIALMSALNIVFPGGRHVDCYYHYCKNVYYNAKKLNLLNTEIKALTQPLLNKLYKIPFVVQKKKIHI